MKKRFLAILLTVVMVLALAVPAAAATISVKETKLELVGHYHNYAADTKAISAPTALNSYKLVRTQHGGLFGYVNYNGQIIVQEKYTQLNDFSEDLALAVKDGSVVYVDRTGKEVITVGNCNEAGNFHQGLARIVSPSNVTYFIDKTGKSVFTCGNNTATDFNSLGLARVTTPAGKCGLVNTQGQEIAHFIFDEIRPFSEGLAYYRIGAHGDPNMVQGFLNAYGQSVFQVVPTMNVGADVDRAADGSATHSDFSNGLVIVENTAAPFDSRIGYLDVTGYQAVHCQFEYGDDFLNNVARIRRAGKWGYVGKSNLYTVQPIFDALDRDTGSGVVRAMQIVSDTVTGGPAIGIQDNHLVITTTPTMTVPYEHWGFVNTQTGNIVVPLIYTNARRFSSDNLAYVEMDTNYIYTGVRNDSSLVNKGFVNLSGALVVNAASYYESIGDSHEGKAWVVKNGKWGYIATTQAGRLAIPMIYDVDGLRGYPYVGGYCDFNNGVAVACWGNALATTDAGADVGRYGVINANGNWLTTNNYTWVDYMIYADRIALAQYGGHKVRFVFY